MYGIEYNLPKQPPAYKMEGTQYSKKEQYFRYTEIPESFEQLEYDSSGNVLWNDKQWDFIMRELTRCRDGHWFLNNGMPTYLTGKYYYFLNYFTLENGDKPQYRDCDRRYYLFLDHCEKSPNILGIIRVKSRREGATSQASSNLIYTATTTEQAKCGIVSKTGEDAKSVFKEMVVYAFRNLPLFMKPDIAAGDDPEKILRFMKQVSRVKKKQQTSIIEKPEGLNSQIDFKNTKLNSYDSKRNTRLLIDEGGKYPTDVPIQRYWPIVRKTLEKGSRKVGFAELPSTVNKLKDGGAGFKILWNESNQFTHKTTPTGLYRYFKPAYDGYEGFIDRYGMSIIDAPTKDQERFLQETTTLTIDEIRLGAKEYLRQRIEKIEDDEMRLEEKRMMPFTEEEAFAADDSESFFNTTLIREQLEYLKDNKPPLRRITFGWDDKNKVDYKDDQNGKWILLKQPRETNAIHWDDSGKKPSNIHRYKIGVDPFASTIIVGKGSNGVIVVYEQLDTTDPENTGMPVAMYVGRPKTKNLFHSEVLMACHYFGCKATYENANDDYFEWFIDKGHKNFITKTPKSVIDPNRKGKSVQTWGVSPKDPFSLNKQLELAQFWVDNYSHKMFFKEIFEDMLEYDHFNRTKSDITVAFMIALVAAAGDVRNVLKEKKEVAPFLATYDISNIR
jgi:hypothetical protein